MEKIFTSIDKNKDKINRYLSNLISFKTINPSNDYKIEIHNCLNYLMGLMEDLGANSQIIKSKGNIPILISSFKGKNSDENKTLIWNGHIDVVPVGDISKWNSNPFDSIIKNDILIGRGSSDMKGSIASAIFAISNVINYDSLKNNIKFIFTCDEETGSKSLMYLNKKTIFNGTACIVGEPSNSIFWDKGISAAESGIMWLKLIFSGKTSHASLNFLGDNAIEKIKLFFNVLPEIRNINQPIYNRYLPLIDQILAEASPKFLNFYKSNLEKIRLSPTMIKGGIKLNIIPDKVEIDIDIRTLPGTNHFKLFNIIGKILKKSGLDDVEIKLMNIQPPSISKSSNNFINLVKNSANTISNNYSLIIHPACTDARFFRRYMPTVTIGCGDIQRAHSLNEFVTFKELIEISKIYALIFQNF
ncbi:MAG: M20 family peptidase [Candidatus Lokiarchaeota archaeon]|nr:M20 family peptidase [Candidatus Lokiarchaeota archaeon]